jgi:hypothetical protein
MTVHARFARVASETDGATIVSTSPALNTVAELIAKEAAVADAAKAIVPMFVPFFWMLKVVAAVAAVPALPRLPGSPAGTVAGAANT